MKWRIPAKTFIVGEYAAIAGESAVILTTEPFFEIELITAPKLDGIHPQSPAGLFWNSQNHNSYGLRWHDPYQGIGGLGASSAQFIGAYWASCYLKGVESNLEQLLHEYFQVSWSGKGLKPSGYDAIAQTLRDNVFINRNSNKIQSYSWPFKDLTPLLLHTGSKLATHHHLEQAILPDTIHELSAIANRTHKAFQTADSQKFILSVNDYYLALRAQNLVAKHSLELINELKQEHPEIKAIKGCGALGADILLLICDSKKIPTISTKNLKFCAITV